jgi:predicted DNA-binding protein with PD1-like motif
MSTHMRQVNPGGTRVYMGTLTGGVDLHASLENIMHTLQGASATFDLLGGLTEAEFTAYDFTTQTRHAPLRVTGAFEIVAGHGTIAWLDESPHVHTHLLLTARDESAPNSVRVIGGHCARATVYAVEFTLTVYDGERVTRQADPSTGLKLWHLPMC